MSSASPKTFDNGSANILSSIGIISKLFQQCLTPRRTHRNYIILLSICAKNVSAGAYFIFYFSK